MRRQRPVYGWTAIYPPVRHSDVPMQPRAALMPATRSLYGCAECCHGSACVSGVLRGIAVSCVLASGLITPAHARLPHGAVLSADEQDADPQTGVTIARGNAEISVAKFAILGRADAIELHPGANEIQFKGGARVTVGEQRYDGEAVTCTLDFSRCATVLPNQASQVDQALPPPSGVGAAATNPR